jgi:DNA-binding response OmpR family regulator
MRTTIAVIEDEERIAGAVAARLRAEGFTVEVAGTGPDGVTLCRRIAPDLVVLDWMLPGYDGIEVCRRIQEERPVPVLFLTARDAEADVLVGLGIGADDYMTKPFSPRELVARVQAILRRTARAAVAPAAAPRIAVGASLVMDLEGRRLLRAGGGEIALTPTEFDLLATLAARPERAFSRDELLETVWGWRSGSAATRTVDSHVAGVRRKVSARIVRTVQGFGYALGSDAP